jgi:hypothetical protein
MIDRIRQDIQERLEQLLAEADRLRHALTELGSADGDGNGRRARAPRRRAARSGAPEGGRSRAGGTASSDGASRKRSAGSRAPSRAARADGAAPGGARNSAGGTKSAVLATLAGADGRPMTAGEVAGSTGLGRASVSTTLSKLARTGEVKKAQRGYQLVVDGGGNPAASGSASRSTGGGSTA